jgi:hypothetical protein
MAGRFNKHINESLKMVADSEQKQTLELPNYKQIAAIESAKTDSFMNFVAYKHSQTQIKNYNEQVQKKTTGKPKEIEMDVPKEFRNYLKEKNFKESEAL